MASCSLGPLSLNRHVVIVIHIHPRLMACSLDLTGKVQPGSETLPRQFLSLKNVVSSWLSLESWVGPHQKYPIETITSGYIGAYI